MMKNILFRKLNIHKLRGNRLNGRKEFCSSKVTLCKGEDVGSLAKDINMELLTVSMKPVNMEARKK